MRGTRVWLLVGLTGCYPFIWPESENVADATFETTRSGSGFVDPYGETCDACLDADGDGFGIAEGAVTVPCNEIPSGWVDCRGEYYGSDFLDCDDTNPNVRPYISDATCDGVDDDCDGEYDEDASGTQYWYLPDADGDGYGDGVSTSVGVYACAAPPGFVSSYAYAQDCDDTDPAVSPGAIEWYQDGRDTDCDTYDADSMNLGNGYDERFLAAISGLADIDGDGALDVMIADSDSSDFAYRGGRIDVHLGPLTGIRDPYARPAPDFVIQGTRPNGNLWPVAAHSEAGSVTLLLGMDPAGTGSGGELRYWNGADPRTAFSGAMDALDGSVAVWTLETELYRYWGPLGGATATVVADGSATPDVLVTELRVDSYQYNAVVLLSDPATGGDLSLVADRVEGTTTDLVSGHGLAAADLTGDGALDVVTSGTTDAYATAMRHVSVYDMPSGTVPSSSYLARIDGLDANAGPEGFLVGDIDGDGQDDLMVGEPSDTYNTGLVSLFLGPLSGDIDKTTADTTGAGNAYTDRFGLYFALGGDVDGSGTADVLIRDQESTWVYDTTDIAAGNWTPFLQIREASTPVFLAPLDGDALADVVLRDRVLFGEARP